MSTLLKQPGEKLKQGEKQDIETFIPHATFHGFSISRLEERHAAQTKGLCQEAEDLRAQLAQMEKELHYLRTELEAQKEANVRSPSNTMKNLVERLKTQLVLKEKQLKVPHSE